MDLLTYPLIIFHLILYNVNVFTQKNSYIIVILLVYGLLICRTNKESETETEAEAEAADGSPVDSYVMDGGEAANHLNRVINEAVTSSSHYSGALWRVHLLFVMLARMTPRVR